jgi:hypothetical protein
MPVVADTIDVAVPIRRSGVLADAFRREVARAEVAAAFDRCLYLRADDRFVCIGEPPVANGPLTMIAGLDDRRRWNDLGLRPGQPARIAPDRIVIEATHFTFARCEVWRAPPWSRPTAALRDVHAAIVRIAQAQAPAGSIIRFGDRQAPGTGFARLARPRMARFAGWLRAAGRGAPTAPQPVWDLIGLGPGLTPSGDDVLAGALAALDALAAGPARAALARAVADAPPGLTSPLSACLLRAAAAGHIGEPLRRAASAAVEGDAEAAVLAIRHVGHSSGWDMLAGIVAAFDAMAVRAV